MSRKIARETVYKLIFEYLFNKGYATETKDLFLQDVTLTDDDRTYIDRVYRGVTDNFEDLKEIIRSSAEGFDVDRIFKPDFSALLLAIYEMKYEDDIPLTVSISEAVDLVKNYSTEKSGAFVNGILASVYKNLSEKSNS